ncbi:tyrosine-type recombinase/integrase [Allohahella marinimesophila]|uniref:Tyr recombinase domain-containing protein n=1 Tax=Allohahella marinimesophila TaxID=1054972 RepID=A0ABP7NUG6_9GAMM
MAKQNKTVLSDTAVRRVPFQKDDEKPREIYDSSCPGLVLRVTQQTKTFYARYMHAGKRQREKIGIAFVRNGDLGISYATAVERCQTIVEQKSHAGARHGNISTLHYLDNLYKLDRASCTRKSRPVSYDTIRDIKLCLSEKALKGRIRNLSNDDFEDFLRRNAEREKPIKDVSIRKLYYGLNAMLNTMVEAGRIPVNPLKKKSYPKDSGSNVNTYPVDLIPEIVADLLDPEFGKDKKGAKPFGVAGRLILATMMDTGCRPGEIRLNRAKNFRFGADPWFHVPAEICKTNQARDVVITSQAVADALESYIAMIRHRAPDDRLFIQRSGKFVSDSIYRRLWKKVAEKYELTGKAYDWRHTYSTWLYEETSDIRLVSEMIGDSIETASKYYIKKGGVKARKRIRELRAKGLPDIADQVDEHKDR